MIVYYHFNGDHSPSLIPRTVPQARNDKGMNTKLRRFKYTYAPKPIVSHQTHYRGAGQNPQFELEIDRY
jgi:hypothetical protein